jgi:hypothetical protein
MNTIENSWFSIFVCEEGIPQALTNIPYSSNPPPIL